MEKVKSKCPPMLTLIKQLTFKCNHPRALFKCECGNEKEMDLYSVNNGYLNSCGCYKKEISRINATKFSHNIKQLNGCYRSMISRCYDKNNIEYKNYGGRGVTVCSEWLDTYQNFLTWALNNGWQKGLQLDKDKNANGRLIHSPETCCFLTPKENTNNRRNTLWVIDDGKKMSLKELCELLDLNYNIVQKQFKAGKHISIIKHLYLNKTKYAS